MKKRCLTILFVMLVLIGTLSLTAFAGEPLSGACGEAVESPFTDVQTTDWFFAPVLWAKETGVTGGKTATTFAPDESCTRAQVVTFLWAANGKPAPKSASNPFTDCTDASVLALVKAGVIDGMTETTFQPDGTLTRAQITKIIHLLVKL